MIKITFNPLQLIKAILLGILILIMLTLNVSWFFTFGFDDEVAYRVKLIDKSGSGSSRNFIMLDEETGKTVSVYPTEEWFERSREGAYYTVDLNPSRFKGNGWITLWIIVSWLSMIVSVIWFLVWSISKIADNIHKLDKEIEVYLKQPTWKKPIRIERIVEKPAR